MTFADLRRLFFWSLSARCSRLSAGARLIEGLRRGLGEIDRRRGGIEDSIDLLHEDLSQDPDTS